MAPFGSDVCGCDRDSPSSTKGCGQEAWTFFPSQGQTAQGQRSWASGMSDLLEGKEMLAADSGGSFILWFIVHVSI